MFGNMCKCPISWSRSQICTSLTSQEVKGTSHPGVCDPHGAPQCQGRNDFVSCELDEFEVCDAIKTPDIITLDVTFPRHTIPNTETNYMCMTFNLPAGERLEVAFVFGVILRVIYLSPLSFSLQKETTAKYK